MDSLIFELQIVFYFQLFLSANVRHNKRNRQLAFELQNSHVYEKCSKRIGKNAACFLNALSEEPVFCIYKCQQYTFLNENDKIDKFSTLKEQRWLWVSISIDLSNGFTISVFID